MIRWFSVWIIFFLFLPRTTQGRDPIKEADIRPIAKTLDWNKQRQMWNKLRKGVNDASNSSQKSSMACKQNVPEAALTRFPTRFWEQSSDRHQLRTVQLE